MPVTLSRWLAVVRTPVLGGRFSETTNRPTRTSHTVLADSVCVRWPKVIAGTDAWFRVVASNGVAVVGGGGLTHDSW